MAGNAVGGHSRSAADIRALPPVVILVSESWKQYKHPVPADTTVPGL